MYSIHEFNSDFVDLYSELEREKIDEKFAIKTLFRMCTYFMYENLNVYTGEDDENWSYLRRTQRDCNIAWSCLRRNR